MYTYVYFVCSAIIQSYAETVLSSGNSAKVPEKNTFHSVCSECSGRVGRKGEGKKIIVKWETPSGLSTAQETLLLFKCPFSLVLSCLSLNVLPMEYSPPCGRA